MSEELASKRRRFESAPTNQQLAQPLYVASIDSLPDAVLQHCFSFLGPNHYRYVAGTSRHFNEIYSIKHQRETRWEIAAASVACSRLCLKDFAENGGEDENGCLEMIAMNGSMKIENIKVLERARNKGLDFESKDFNFPTRAGHLCVLQWAEEKNLEWYGEDTLIASVLGGQIHILEWIQERNLLDASWGPDLYDFASRGVRTNVLDWLHDNGYVVCRDSILHGAALGNDFEKTLIWARQHNIVLDERACLCAALDGNLPMLQWLRENECPWDARVIMFAEEEGHNHVLEWATANGCPTE